MEINRGFTGGYNEALKHISADYYVILNSDVEVTEGWLAPQIELLENDKTIKATQPKILSYKKRDHFEHAGAGGGYIDKLGYPFCRGRLFTKAELDEGQYNDTCEIFWATGACMVIRSSTFHELGGFETAFFAHMEEIDLCWRIQNTGGKVFYVGSCSVFHVGGATLDSSNPRKTFLNFRNGLALMVRNLSGRSLIPILFFRMCLDGVAAIEFLLVGYPKDSWAVLRAHMSFYAKMKTWWAGRMLNKSMFVAHNKTNIYQGSIVWQYFILKRQKYTELRKNHNS